MFNNLIRRRSYIRINLKFDWEKNGTSYAASYSCRYKKELIGVRFMNENLIMIEQDEEVSIGNSNKNSYGSTCLIKREEEKKISNQTKIFILLLIFGKPFV